MGMIVKLIYAGFFVLLAVGVVYELVTNSRVGPCPTRVSRLDRCSR